ncbi:glycosyltransferase family 2 protein [Paenibacillus sp. FSL W7-1279]|uniref:glycosyltransferase family 2 protein n=1 Tax=Paenibacillus sp. FSL W7-1279 TaxID=2921697 RepID=UPI0030D829E6
MKLPISVCIVTRNEESNIKECMMSVKKYMEEVVVLDTGSNDQTVGIVTEEGGIVRETEWCNDFSRARNKVIEYASQPYILMLDADERLIDADVEKIQKDLIYLSNHKQMAGKVEIHNILESGTVRSNIVRLFPNQQEFSYVGIIHEQLLYKNTSPATYNTNLTIAHYGYNQTHILNKDKIKRNLELLHKQLQENLEDPYILFQLGRTYSVSKQDDLSVMYLEKAYLISDFTLSYRSTIIRSLAKAYLKEKKWEKLMILLKSSLITYPCYTDLYYIYGCALIEMKTPESFHLIPQAFEKCVALGEADSVKYETENGVGSYLAHYNLGLYYEVSMKPDQARYHYKKSSDYGFDLACNRLAHLL